MEILRENAQSGSIHAQYELALAVFESDSAEAIHWLERAARMEHVLAREVLTYLRREENPSRSNSGPRLRAFMEWLSESCWCAGWMDGLEYELWAALDRPGFTYGVKVVTPLELATLRWLSDQCDGWFAWSDSRGAPIFVDRLAWQDVLSRRRSTP